MNILALDTATEACSAALWCDGQVVAQRFEQAPRRQAELILPFCQAVLDTAGLRPQQLDAIAFGRGPGAFTGVRVAVSVVQGIAFAADLPVLPISTLAAMAYGSGRFQAVPQIAVAIDARMGEIYWAGYRRTEAGLEPLMTEQVGAAENVSMAPVAGAWVGVGTGWGRYRQRLEQRCPVAECWPEMYPDAVDIAALAAIAWQRGEAVPPEQALPVYLRDRVVAEPSC